MRLTPDLGHIHQVLEGLSPRILGIGCLKIFSVTNIAWHPLDIPPELLMSEGRHSGCPEKLVLNPLNSY
jgi:hypothetical protein